MIHDPGGRFRLRLLLTALAALGAAAGLLLLVMRGERLPAGPQEPAWDREACAECRMHVGDPRFAVQAQLTDGSVLSFDDPGCWFALERRDRPEVHALYFRDFAGDGWIPASEARFVRTDATPMGYGLAAVSMAGTMSLQEARSAAAVAVAATPARGHSP